MEIIFYWIDKNIYYRKIYYHSDCLLEALKFYICIYTCIYYIWINIKTELIWSTINIKLESKVIKSLYLPYWAFTSLQVVFIYSACYGTTLTNTSTITYMGIVVKLKLAIILLQGNNILTIHFECFPNCHYSQSIEPLLMNKIEYIATVFIKTYWYGWLQSRWLTNEKACAMAGW